MPDGYASNISRCVDLRNSKLIGMKSHDCHIFMEYLLPIALRALPDVVWNPLTEISQFFRNMCAARLIEETVIQCEQNIPIILCKLERIFPPGFFDSMEHLPIPLPYEARMGGPVQYRWMYPFERYLNKLKKTVKNKTYPEGSMCEAYLTQETTHFCSYYFEAHVQCNRTKVARNDDVEFVDTDITPTLSIFKSTGRSAGKCMIKYLTDKELAAAALFVLLNCDEAQPILEKFVESLHSEDLHYIDKKIDEDFTQWFKTYVHNAENKIDDQDLHDLAWGPLRVVKTWNIYIVNGFRFHTKAWSEGRKTNNSGVCVVGNTHTEEQGDYFGELIEIIQLQYPGLNEKTLILFSCDWFDPVANQGTRTHKQYSIVEIKSNRKYSKYEPFILANQATQVYYSKYPDNIKDKVDWLVVIKTKPRGVIDVKQQLELAVQEDMMSNLTTQLNNVEDIHSLHVGDGHYQEFSQLQDDNTEDDDDVHSSDSEKVTSSEEEEN